MGKPLMIQEQDDERIERLKKRLGVKTKVEIVRSALTLLEKDTDRLARIERWNKAATAVAATSREVNAEFRTHSRLKRT